MDNALPERKRLDPLIAALAARGLSVVTRPSAAGTVLTVKNPAAQADTSLGATMYRGLSQDVVLRDTEHGPVWCWVWDPPVPATRGEPTPPAEIEPIRPAEGIAQVADKIAGVLRANEPAGAPQ